MSCGAEAPRVEPSTNLVDTSLSPTYETRTMVDVVPPYHVSGPVLDVGSETFPNAYFFTIAWLFEAGFIIPRLGIHEDDNLLQEVATYWARDHIARPFLDDVSPKKHRAEIERRWGWFQRLMYWGQTASKPKNVLSGSNFADVVRDQIKWELAFELAQERAVATLDDEVRAEFEKKRHKYQIGAKVHARHILIKLQARPSKKEERSALARAVKIAKEAQANPERFAELARTHSEGPTGKKGGDLGFFERGRMVKPFENSAFSLQPGEVSEPVRTRFGYHILKVEERREGRAQSYDEVSENIRRELERKKRTIFDKKVREIAKSIERFPDRIEREPMSVPESRF